MTRIRSFYLLVPCLILLLASCSQEGFDRKASSRPGAVGAPEKYAAGETGYCTGADHDRYEGFLANDQGIVSMIVQDWIDWETGGVIDATPGSWPEGYEVKMIVPPYCLDPSTPGHESALFGIGVPAFGTDPDPTSVPFHFYPDGANFVNPPQLRLSWPGWAGVPESGTISLVTVRTIVRDGETHYELPDVVTWDVPGGGEGMTPPTDVELSTGYEFEIAHFSRWEMVDGDESDDGDPPTHDDPTPDTPPPPSCWTEFPPEDPDPFTPIGVAR